MQFPAIKYDEIWWGQKKWFLIIENQPVGRTKDIHWCWRRKGRSHIDQKPPTQIFEARINKYCSYLNPWITPVSHQDIVLCVNSNSCGGIKLTISFPCNKVLIIQWLILLQIFTIGSEAENEVTIFCENLQQGIRFYEECRIEWNIYWQSLES